MKVTLGTKKSEIRSMLNSINQDLDAISKEIINLSTNIQKMMNGNEAGPYWNGKKAKTFYTQAIKNLSNDLEDYKTAYKWLDLYTKEFDSAVYQDER